MTRTETIQAAFEKYGSDKAQHGYAKFYAQYLPENPTSILEVGVKTGSSMRAWKELFPNTKLFGLDLFIEFPPPSIEGVTWFKGDQMDPTLLYHIRNDVKPEICIEDASHNCINHWVTLYSLISGCEQYYVEDLHSCQEEFYRQGLQYTETLQYAIKSRSLPFYTAMSYDSKIAMLKQRK